MMAGSDSKKDSDCATRRFNSSYEISMSLGFLVASIGLGAIVSFLLGQAARSRLITQYSKQPPVTLHGVHDGMAHRSLPPPFLGAAKQLPSTTRYMSKHYETKGTGSESFLVRSSKDAENVETQRTGLESREPSGRLLSSKLDLASGTKNRLTSEVEIVHLLNELMSTSQDTILSYHCHKVGVQQTSCTGIATQGHITIHSVPGQMSITTLGISLDDVSTAQILGQPLITLPAMTQDPRARSSQSKTLQVANALVHPALLTHKQPESVVLVGGSRAVVQEILRYESVKHLTVLESISSWNDACLQPGTESVETCEGYSRLDFQEERANAWFAHRRNNTVDAVIVESRVQPNVIVDIVRTLKKKSGVLTVRFQVHDADDKWVWIEELTTLSGEVENIKEYGQGEASFLIAFPDDLLGRWYGNEAEVNVEIHGRVSDPLPDFDGATMQSYQYPSRVTERAFCERYPDDATCSQGHGLDPSKQLVPISSFEVKLSTVQNAGRGIFLTHDAEEGVYIFVDGCVQNIHITDQTVRVMDEFFEGEYKNISMKKWETLMWYTDGYGFVVEDFGERAYDVDPGIGTFVNHGCNGTTNVGSTDDVGLTEQSFSFATESPVESSGIYHPAFDRTMRSHNCAESTSLRRIEKGEEIFNNYMTFEAAVELAKYAESLRNECSGRQFGQISEYEISAQGYTLPSNTSNIDGSCPQCRMMQDVS